ncbi:MAG: hypothetical protein GY780_06885, partial [bacterium]|nr:hypothetical protein [bacterium]
MRRPTSVMAVLVILTAGVVFASEAPNLGGGEERYINGHGFLPSQYVQDPFVGTKFDTRLGGSALIRSGTGT